MKAFTQLGSFFTRMGNPLKSSSDPGNHKSAKGNLGWAAGTVRGHITFARISRSQISTSISAEEHAVEWGFQAAADQAPGKRC
jgi:hypothetical protein